MCSIVYSMHTMHTLIIEVITANYSLIKTATDRQDIIISSALEKCKHNAITDKAQQSTE